ncbi:MAG: hypothetical protein RQ922_02580 [Thermoproteota archaeon]|nr:hypothetical protein [Thermoproteota archaeon]
MNVQELAEIIRNKNITILGKRYSGKTILSIYFILKNLEFFNNIYIFYPDFFSFYPYFSYLKKISKKIQFFHKNNFKDLKETLANILENLNNRDLLFFDKFSLLLKLELEERIKIYSNIMKFFLITTYIIKKYNGTILINYTFKENDKIINIIKYWSDILISIDRNNNVIKLSILNLSEDKETGLEIDLDYLLSMIKYDR